MSEAKPGILTSSMVKSRVKGIDTALQEIPLKPSPEVQSIYEQQKGKIEEIYSQVTDWHGSGRYQYRKRITNGESVYEEVDALTQILNSGELIPHPDGFNKRKQGDAPSLSFTHARPYAMMYATTFFPEREDYKYQFHSPEFWEHRLIWSAVKRLPKAIQERHKRTGEPYRDLLGHLKPSGMDSLRTRIAGWASTRNPNGKDPKGAFATRSPIEGNYPILYGVKEDAYEKAPTLVQFDTTETRSLTPIPLSSLTHIEVPLDHVEETQAILDAHGASLPIIPIELGEIYSSRFTPDQLLDGNPFRKTV